MSGPRVAVIIPTFDGAAYLPACLDALRRQTERDFAVVVVDDGSTDGTADLLAARYPDVRVLRRPANGGLAVACNDGIAATASEYVALLNNDTEPEPGWLAALVAALDAAPAAASAASKLLLHDQRDTLHSAGDGYTVTGLPVNRGVWRRDAGQYDAATEVFGACAGAALYRRAALVAVAGPGGRVFDEDLFMYCEDVDLNWRLQLAGYRCVFAPAARVYHRLSATGGGPLASYFCGRNFLLVLAKDVPRPLLRRYWPRIAAAQLGHAWRAARNWRGAAARATLRGMAAGLAAAPRFWRKRRAPAAGPAPDLARIERLLLDPARRTCARDRVQ
ncbi:MAG TPA: glycosyltransferase family 2 protein [Thermomicrobiales bacterium]|nr:glycosyltransferase family 2 protein [Thermomicrobiales bacterium]